MVSQLQRSGQHALRPILERTARKHCVDAQVVCLRGHEGLPDEFRICTWVSQRRKSHG